MRIPAKNNSGHRISRKKFIELVGKFQEATEEVFGTKCRVEINVLDNHRVAPERPSVDFLPLINSINDKATFYRTDNPNTIDEKIWKQAASIRVVVSAVDARAADFVAWGHFDKHISPCRFSFQMVPDANKRALKDILITTPPPRKLGALVL